MSPVFVRSALELRAPMARVLPSLVLPIRRAATRSVATTSSVPTAKEPMHPVEALLLARTVGQDKSALSKEQKIASKRRAVRKQSNAAIQHAACKQKTAALKKTQAQGEATKSSWTLLYPRQPQEPVVIPQESKTKISQLLPALRAQPNHYITIHIWGFPYLVQAGDRIRLPFKMPGVLPGDVLRLDRASVLGSRDYTLKGEPYIDERLFECRAVVTGTETEPLRLKIKKKRRERRKKIVKSKHRYTILRISELNIKGPEAIDL